MRLLRLKNAVGGSGSVEQLGRPPARRWRGRARRPVPGLVVRHSGRPAPPARRPGARAWCRSPVESSRMPMRRCPASSRRCTAARAPPRLSSSTVSASSPPAGRSRKTTGMPISTSARRNEWSSPAGTTSRPSTRREQRSRSSWLLAVRVLLGAGGDQQRVVVARDLGRDIGDGGVERVADLLDEQPDGRGLTGPTAACWRAGWAGSPVRRGGQHPVDQRLLHIRRVVDDAGDRLQTDAGVAGDVDHRGPASADPLAQHWTTVSTARRPGPWSAVGARLDYQSHSASSMDALTRRPPPRRCGRRCRWSGSGR